MLRTSSLVQALARRATTQRSTVVSRDAKALSLVLARRTGGANTRSITTSRARLNADKPPAAAEGAPAGQPQDALVLSPYQKVTATATGGFWLAFLGLGAAGVYFVGRELMPNRMSPNGLFSEALDLLSENTDVTTRLGMPVYGYGHDNNRNREGRRNRIEHVNLKDKDGNPRLRIKFNIKGPAGHANVFAEVNHDMPKGEFVYLICQFTKTNELVKIIDNRQILLADSKEEQDALRQLLGKQ